MAASDVGTVQERGTALPILITRVAIWNFAVDSYDHAFAVITQIGAAFGLGLVGGLSVYRLRYFQYFLPSGDPTYIIAMIRKAHGDESWTDLMRLRLLRLPTRTALPSLACLSRAWARLRLLLRRSAWIWSMICHQWMPPLTMTMTHGIAGIGMIGGVVYSGLTPNAGYDWRTIYT